MTRTQKAEQARKQVEEYLNRHLPGSGWKITRSRDSIFPESHGGRHTMGLYSACCILQNMENGKLLQDAQDHLNRYASDALIPFISQQEYIFRIDCGKCGAYSELQQEPDAIARLRPESWASELWDVGWRVDKESCLCTGCADE